jgi:hypothetical protein
MDGLLNDLSPQRKKIMPLHNLDEYFVYDLADKIYWEVLDVLKIEHKCVEVDPDDPEGTKNTELGMELYFAIENIIDRSLKDD